MTTSTAQKDQPTLAMAEEDAKEKYERYRQMAAAKEIGCIAAS